VKNDIVYGILAITFAILALQYGSIWCGIVCALFIFNIV